LRVRVVIRTFLVYKEWFAAAAVQQKTVKHEGASERKTDL
jgi:hypothetical protein